ncbi:AI-2E family transporter [Anaerocolumna sp. MB42-C2]|uniref:AI-2E family transporter n=1 Tax=Anaerocolumna sp. MB42-C2 TaxID=3070997 RepID=UPI0027E141C8|nr:AI-2E family transporter [Anaerocolumna sp. MB42-C2]WMJ90064.1 AI-2E family transporter [Anaerocolumna sp. MB42-C2]
MNWNNKLNKRYTLISLYVIVTCIIIYCLSLVAKSAPSIIKDIMSRVNWFMQVAKPILFGFVFAYLFDPLNDFLEEKLKKIKIKNKQLKSTRSWAVLITIILFFIVIIGIISILVFTVTDQLRLANFDDIIVLVNSYLNTFNDFYNSISAKLDDLNIQSNEITQYVKDAATYILNYLKTAGMSLATSISNISTYITTFLFSFIIAIYFMIDGKMILDYIKKVGKALLSDKWNTRIARFLADADSVFSGYIRGQLTDALVMAVLISITLSITGVKFAVIIGILAGIGNLVPYLGPIVAYFSTALICIINGQYKVLIAALIALFIIQAIDGNIIAPKLLSQSIQIHPVLVIISLIFGSAIGGLLGMLLAVPVGALIKVLFVRYINHQLEKKEAESNNMTK